MKRIISLLLLLPSIMYAQNQLCSSSSDYRPFKHMEMGLTAGTTGIGFHIATPINEHLNVRAGFSYMPKISFVKPYAMSACGQIGQETTPEEQQRKIERLCGYLGNLVQSDNIDEYVDMDHQFTFYNAKLLLDWYPFHKKNWHFTAGIYIGSKQLAKAINTQEESPTMLAVRMYNKTYDQIQKLGPYEYPSYQIGTRPDGTPIYFELDPVNGQYVKDGFNYYGAVAVQLGTFPDGTPHYMRPDENGTMFAIGKTSPVKPYVGFGYNVNIGPQRRWSFGFDAGLLIWGKAPHIYCPDNGNQYTDYMHCDKTQGVCLTHDVDNVGGQVASLLNLIKKMPVYPVLELRLAYTLY